ncbi:PRKR-interacting protein 1 homolog isoform X2 [Lineus longissimus]|uniref:PRKR-interacting protein 1 homolog isoform X2 n=1 Tax=Lineus longissimus TaxID=88925 RepID=UPI002B4FA192
MAAKEEKVVIVPQTPAEIQRLKLQKLMNKPDKPVVIPDGPQEKAPRAPPEFVRNVWGSSAGAGSGEFHVYRGIRRREYARQKFNTEKSEREKLDQEYVDKVEQNKKAAEERTAKKRAKRQKKKQKQRSKKPKATEKDKGWYGNVLERKRRKRAKKKRKRKKMNIPFDQRM